ncbi:MAG: carboxypeptidase [Candidatus Marinimicrobia bacterium]|nr:carboxypeptidase [Candidatus Neomarinimicrobiota bacterium]
MIKRAYSTIPKLTVGLLVLYLLGCAASPGLRREGTGVTPVSSVYQAAAVQLISAALADSFAYNRLAELTDSFGPRFSGTKNLEDAIDWILEEMRQDGFENVRGEEVMIPRWVRGNEWARLEAPWKKELAMLGLGGSVATPAEGITAEVLVVGSFEELEKRADEAEGKIVLFNVPFTNYGETVRYRYAGASAAAKAGGVASLIRSVGPFSMNTPHTGGMSYEEDVPKIPHAAITVEDAAMLGRTAKRGERIVVTLYMEAHFEDDVPSRNVVAELVGREKPEEIVVLGGHIDSWDVGQGAMDDGGGCVAAWQAVKLMQDLGLRPRRTVRVVLWTNEENGLRGGNGYRDAHREELDNHILAMESDAGVFKPEGFGFSGSPEALSIIRKIAQLLQPIGAGEIKEKGGGADIGPIMKEGVPGMGLNVDGSNYFWYHHTNADTMDKLDPHEMNLCVAAMAVMAYVVADMPKELPR